eukprot:6728786-Prymnesium_polylepis.1
MATRVNGTLETPPRHTRISPRDRHHREERGRFTLKRLYNLSLGRPDARATPREIAYFGRVPRG